MVTEISKTRYENNLGDSEVKCYNCGWEGWAYDAKLDWITKNRRCEDCGSAELAPIDERFIGEELNFDVE